MRPEATWQPLCASELRRAAATMVNKAEGPDGVSAQALLSLPPAAWDRFAQLLCRFEHLGVWPDAVHHWRVQFLPKSSSAAIDKFRPISVGSMVYRIWAKCRVKGCGHLIEAHLGSLQANSKCDCEVMHLALQAEFPVEQFGLGLALDYQKAFDSINCSLGLELLARVGVPKKVLNLLGDQWLNQKKWLSLGGVIHQECMTGITSLPQGDPWSPLTMSLVLSCPTKRCEVRHPLVGCAVYLDDRTLVGADWTSLQAAYNEWETLSTVTRLRTNPAKTQLWPRNANMARFLETADVSFPVTCQAEVLGYVLGNDPHTHPKWTARAAQEKAMATRIAMLPCHQDFKQRVATALLVGSASWGKNLCQNGLDEAQEAHLRNFCFAVFGNSGTWEERQRGCPNDRASPILKQLLILGHCSDLRFLLTTRFLNALSRWLAFRRFPQHRLAVVRPHWAGLVQAATEHLAGWDFQPTMWGVWSDNQGNRFDLSMPKVERTKAMHFIRHGWRKSMLRRWLATRRIDAEEARSVRLGDAISYELIDKLRKVFKRAVGPHERGIILGSMRTSATVFWGSAPQILGCPDCLDQSVRPTVHHVLWDCPAYGHLRHHAPPPCVLAQRLGWSHNVPSAASQKLIPQMGAIREAEVINRMARERSASAGRLTGGASSRHTEVTPFSPLCIAAGTGCWRGLLAGLALADAAAAAEELALLRGAAHDGGVRPRRSFSSFYSMPLHDHGSHLLSLFCWVLRRVYSVCVVRVKTEKRPQQDPCPDKSEHGAALVRKVGDKGRQMAAPNLCHKNENRLVWRFSLHRNVQCLSAFPWFFWNLWHPAAPVNFLQEYGCVPEMLAVCRFFEFDKILLGHCGLSMPPIFFAVASCHRPCCGPPVSSGRAPVRDAMEALGD